MKATLPAVWPPIEVEAEALRPVLVDGRTYAAGERFLTLLEVAVRLRDGDRARIVGIPPYARRDAHVKLHLADELETIRQTENSKP